MSFIQVFFFSMAQISSFCWQLSGVVFVPNRPSYVLENEFTHQVSRLCFWQCQKAERLWPTSQGKSPQTWSSSSSPVWLASPLSSSSPSSPSSCAAGGTTCRTGERKGLVYKKRRWGWVGGGGGELRQNCSVTMRGFYKLFLIHSFWVSNMNNLSKLATRVWRKKEKKEMSWNFGEFWSAL